MIFAKINNEYGLELCGGTLSGTFFKFCKLGFCHECFRGIFGEARGFTPEENKIFMFNGYFLLLMDEEAVW